MEGSSPYHQLEKQRRDTNSRRAQEDADFAADQDNILSNMRNEKDQMLSQLLADAEIEEAKLASTCARKKDAEQAMSQFAEKNKADKELLLNTYANKKVEAEIEFECKKKQQQADRAAKDQKRKDELWNIMGEQSSLTIEVEPRVVATTAAPAAEPLHRGHFNAGCSVSAAAAVLESPAKGVEQASLLMRGPPTPQTPQSQLHSQPRVNSITPTKRRMAEGSYENSTPPNLRRFVSDSIRPAADGNISATSSSPASSNEFPSPTTILSRPPNPHLPFPARSISVSSAASQSTTRGSQQNAEHSTPQGDRRQTMGANCSPSGTNSKQLSPFKPTSQPGTITPTTPRPMSRSSFLSSSSPLPAVGGTAVCANFEIISVRYSYAAGGGFFHWTRESDEATRYMRLSQDIYRPVLQQGRRTGSIEWTIDPSRVWGLKYDTGNDLVYIKRSKTDSKTGNAGKDMWIVFKDEDNFNRFLESYREHWPHNKVEVIGMDDEVPLSMLKKRS
ncbi:hypothetical protein BKA65DRAFT_478679 [Rhexocercosporidium sp. MPI-PUGE-AT-0058]|nr:hypothetical protein BKA65DRAFT_478679 [Rhexocercosporidium sp. MPI-PUGE-AT-0058]